MKPIFEQALTLVMAGGRGERLYPLTRDLAKPVVPFGGSYRIIDFTLSNCFNSGIRQIYLLTQYSNLTMTRHLRLAWDSLFRGELDEFIEALPPQHRTAEDWYRGTADSIYQNIELLEAHKPEYVLVLSGDHVYKMDYSLLLEYHIEKHAELTIAAVEIERAEAQQMGVLGVDADCRVREFVEKPENPPPIPKNSNMSLVSMGVYVFNTAKLVRELIRDAKDPHSKRDFGRNIIPSLIERDEMVMAYPFREERTRKTAYWRDIGTLDSYYTTNLDLADPYPEIDLYEQRWPIRTYFGQFPPARVVDSSLDLGLHGTVVDSLICSGCVISGGRVEKSVLSPQVRVHTGAEVTESVLMERVDIGRRAVVRRALLCPGVHVPDGATIGVNHEDDAARFIVTPKGVTVVPGDFTW
ncbi:glucose-1-phosphate adenylyltransferase [bacterium]|nr:glucose-1-phosphate adenylyltransferase [bacterium]MBU1985142.1 glucose-1-phosphate adenylyltransferase [bacterium]